MVRVPFFARVTLSRFLLSRAISTRWLTTALPYLLPSRLHFFAYSAEASGPLDSPRKAGRFRGRRWDLAALTRTLHRVPIQRPGGCVTRTDLRHGYSARSQQAGQGDYGRWLNRASRSGSDHRLGRTQGLGCTCGIIQQSLGLGWSPWSSPFYCDFVLWFTRSATPGYLTQNCRLGATRIINAAGSLSLPAKPTVTGQLQFERRTSAGI